MVKDGRLLALELKTETGRASAEQEAWIDAMQQVTDVRAAIVRPRDLQALADDVLSA